MKAKALFLVALAIGLSLGLAVPARGSNVTGAYVIVASDETAQNTSDGNPLQITFDLTESRSGVTVINILSNSNCINADTLSQQLVNPAVLLNHNGTIASFTFGSAVDSSVFVFSATQYEDGVYTGTFSATNGCASSDSGNFVVQAMTAPPGRNRYAGMLNAQNGANNEASGFSLVPTNVSFHVNGKFMMDGTNVQILAPLCAGGPVKLALTVNPQADSIGGFQSIQSGNVLLFNATDSTDTNTITFIATPTGVDGDTNTPGSWDLSYYVDTGVCAGAQGSGSPFSIQTRTVPAIQPRFSGNSGLAH